MKLSFSQLESARQNPKRFGQKMALKKKAYANSKNFRSYFGSAMLRFHRGMSKEDVIKFFDKKCQNLALQNHFEGRLTQYKKALSAYCDSYAAQGSQFVEYGKSLLLTVGMHVVSGRVGRLDLRVPVGYRVTLTQMEQSDWGTELRWPLMQKAVANEFGCDTAEVEVGVFSLDTTEYEYKTFAAEEIEDAEKEANEVLSEVESYLHS